MIRLLRTAVTAGVALVLLLAALALVAASTPAGSAFLLRALLGLAGDTVAAEQVEGTLLDGLRAERVLLRRPNLTVTVERAEVQVFWPDLLRERLTLVTARAAALRLDLRRDPDRAREPVQPLMLPVVLAARDLQVERLEIRVDDREPVIVSGGQLRGLLVRGELDVDFVQARLYGVDVQARGRMGTGEPFRLEAELEWQVPAAGVRGAGPARGSLAALEFTQSLAVPDPVTVTGTLEVLGDAPRLAAVARWDQVRRDLGGPGVLASREGELRVAGWTEGYEAAFQGVLVLDQRPPLAVTAAATGTLDTLDITALEARGLGGVTTGTARLQLTGGLRGEFRLAARNLDPGMLDPRFRGRVNGLASGDFAGTGDFRVVLEQGDGEWLGRPFRASGRLARTGTVFQLQDFQAASGPNRLRAAGRWGTELAAEFQVDAADLGALLPGWRGSLAGSGEVGGTLGRPRFRVDLAGAGIGSGPLGLETLAARGGLARNDRVDLDLQVTGITRGGTALGDLALAATGPLAGHALEIRFPGGPVPGVLAGEGAWAGGRYAATFRTGALDLPGEQRWVLAEPAELALWPGRREVGLGGHCWALAEPAGDGRFCVADARATPEAQAGGLTLRRFPITLLADLGLLPPGLRLTGTADVDAAGERRDGRLTGQLRWEQRDTEVAYRTEEGDEISTRLDDFLVSVEGSDAAVEFRGVVSESFGTLLTAAGTVTDPLAAEPVLAGRIVGSIPDLARLGPVVESLADVGDLQGRVTVDVTLSGRLRQPAILGGLELADGALTVPAAGVTVDRVQLTLTGQPDGRVVLKGAARSGNGFVELGGELLWRDRLVPAIRLTAKGRNLEAIRLPEGTVLVTPNLAAELVAGQFRVTGDVLVPKADIVVKQLDEGAVVPSPDTVVHGRATVAAVRRQPLFVVDDLTLRLGPAVRFQGFGLDTRLRGSLVLGQEDRSNPDAITATGSVQVAEGRFSILGEELTIDRGNLVFGGTVTDPGVDARASRRVNWEGRDVTVGVLLSGTLSRIQTRVFSEPAMGEMDALSYLTTGKPLSANTAGDRFSVSSAALSLGLQGALPVAQKLGSALNVDEIGLAGSTGDGTEVVIGERIGDDLYLRYSYGIFNKLGTIKATYRIGRRLSIEGSSGEEQALDLLYSIQW